MSNLQNIHDLLPDNAERAISEGDMRETFSLTYEDMLLLKDKSEDNWKTVATGNSSNFVIEYSDQRTRFRVNTSIDVPKSLLNVNFTAPTDRAIEFYIFNNTNLNINIAESATSGLSKGFASYNMPFSILPKSHALLKYNPETDLIEAWRVNTPGFSYPSVGNNGDVLEKDNATSNGAKWVDRFSGLTNTFVSFWNGSKFITSIIAQVTSRIGIGTTTPAEVLDVNGRAKATSLVLASDIFTAIPNELGRKSGRIGFAGADGIFREILIFGQTYEHTIRGKRVVLTGTGSLDIDLNIGSHFSINATSATTVNITNMIAVDETCAITLTVTGSLITLPTWLTKDSYSDIPDASKTREYNIVIKRGGTSPLGRYTVINN